MGPLKNLAGNHSEDIVVANGPGTMIQLRPDNPHAPGRIVSTGYSLDMNNPGESGSQLPYYTDDKETRWPRKYAQQDYVPLLDESQLVELTNGVVLMLSRNYRNCSMAVGADGKPTWWGWGQGICAALTRSTECASRHTSARRLPGRDCPLSACLPFATDSAVAVVGPPGVRWR